VFVIRPEELQAGVEKRGNVPPAASTTSGLSGVPQAGPTASGRHFGSRVVEALDGTLFLTLGDRGDRDEAQRLSSHNGSVLRVARDGSIPADNPFTGHEGARPEIWSYGHRNPQGAALGPDGALWTVEHGPRGGDEVNLTEGGRNYGWPVQSFGREYNANRPVGQQAPLEGVTPPLWHWQVSPAVSGLAVYAGELFPGWQGDLFTGALQHDTIIRLEAGANGVTEAERLFDGAYPRIRDVREAPDGSIWFLSEGDGALYRVTPAP
jgi:glucose/arabinose dehydrogenase